MNLKWVRLLAIVFFMIPIGITWAMSDPPYSVYLPVIMKIEPSLTQTPTSTSTRTPTTTSTSTPTSTATSTNTPTRTSTATSTSTSTLTATSTNTPTRTPTATSTATPTQTSTPGAGPKNGRWVFTNTGAVPVQKGSSAFVVSDGVIAYHKFSVWFGNFPCDWFWWNEQPITITDNSFSWNEVGGNWTGYGDFTSATTATGWMYIYQYMFPNPSCTTSWFQASDYWSAVWSSP